MMCHLLGYGNNLYTSFEGQLTDVEQAVSNMYIYMIQPLPNITKRTRRDSLIKVGLKQIQIKCWRESWAQRDRTTGGGRLEGWSGDGTGRLKAGMYSTCRATCVPPRGFT